MVGVMLAIFIAALVVSRVPFLKYLFSFFAILVHEMGYAFAGWLFGYPSIPSFDFFYGVFPCHVQRVVYIPADHRHNLSPGI